MRRIVRRISTAILLGAIPVLGACGAKPFPGLDAISRADLHDDLYAMASDAMRGRETTTLDELKAASWVAEHARAAGLEPAGENGSFFQWFSLYCSRTSETSSVEVGGDPLQLWRDVVVMSPTQAHAEGNVLWLGSATPADSLRHDVRGRVVAVMAQGQDPPSDSILASRYYVIRTVRRAASVWTRRGASAVFVVADSTLGPLFERAAAYARRGRVTLDEGQPHELATDAPILLVRAASAGALRAGGARALVDVRVDHFDYPSVNVIGRVAGSDPTLRDEYVLFSSHTDHDGVRAAVGDDSIFNGADDNASTSVALLAIARAFTRHPGRRSALFIWHGAEERGLWGSRWHAHHPVVPLDSIVAVLNGDMIGRNNPDSAALLGVVPPHRSSTALVDMALDANRRLGHFALDSTWDRADHPEGWYFRSDHYYYAAENVPAVFFSTLLHPNYHTPFDSPDRIDYAKLERMTDWMYGTGWLVANADQRPTVDPGFKLERSR